MAKTPAPTLNLADLTHDTQGKVIAVKNANQLNWKVLAQTQQLSEGFILANADFFDWNIISENQEITPKIMLSFPKKIKWDKIAKNTQISADGQLVAKYKGNADKILQKEQLSESFLRANHECLDWNTLTRLQKSLSEAFIEDFGDKIDWDSIFYYNQFSEEFIRKNTHQFERYSQDDQNGLWERICLSQAVSEQFLRECQNKCDFGYLARNKKLVLSEAFITDFQYILNEQDVIKTQKKNLSANFLKEYKKYDSTAFYKAVTEEWLNNYPHQNRLNWDLISRNTNNLSENFLEKNWEKLNSGGIITRYTLSEDFIRRISPKIKEKSRIWNDFFKCQNLSQSFLEENIAKVDLSDISYGEIINNLSLDFIRKYEKKWYWKGIGQQRRFDEDFLREYAHKWDWEWNIGYCQRVSEAFLEEFESKFTSYAWQHISEVQILSENFIRKYAKKVHWVSISVYQELSESFMREFATKLEWTNIRLYQDYSESFATEFTAKLNNVRLEDDESMYYLNQRAWAVVQAKDTAKYERSLKNIEKSLFYKKLPATHKRKFSKDAPSYVEDTKVRLLLLMNRENEAFEIVKSCLALAPDFSDFQDFKNNKKYLEWLKNQ